MLQIKYIDWEIFVDGSVVVWWVIICAFSILWRVHNMLRVCYTVGACNAPGRLVGFSFSIFFLSIKRLNRHKATCCPSVESGWNSLEVYLKKASLYIFIHSKLALDIIYKATVLTDARFTSCRSTLRRIIHTKVNCFFFFLFSKIRISLLSLLDWIPYQIHLTVWMNMRLC